MDGLSILQLILQFLVAPVIGWVFVVHQSLHDARTKIQVLEAQATARENARAEDRDTTRRQLDQILAMLQTMSGRIDAVMRNEK